MVRSDDCENMLDMDETLHGAFIMKKRKKTSRHSDRCSNETRSFNCSTDQDDNLLSGSLKNVVTQALVSHDKKLLDFVFLTNDLTVIRRTISQISSEHIELFINEILNRLYQTPLRSGQLVPWLRELLRQNVIFCSSVPSIRESLASFGKHTVLRLRYHYNAIKVQGEIDTICYLASSNSSKSQKETLNSTEPLLIVQETDTI